MLRFRLSIDIKLDALCASIRSLVVHLNALGCGLLLFSSTARAEAPADQERGGKPSGSEQSSKQSDSKGNSEERGSEDQEVVVVGKRRPAALGAQEQGVSSYTIDRARLSQPGISVAEALREAPGVQVTQSGGLGAPSTARLRGATAAQTPVYWGDIRINDEVGGVADLSTIPHYLIERIEVYRGHAPRRMTELGMGGAIVLVPRRAERSESALQAEVGSFGTRALRGRFGVAEGRHRLLVAGETYGTENNYKFEDTRGTLFNHQDGGTTRLDNADNHGHSIWLRASDRWGKAHVSVVAHQAGREQGAPKLALVPSESARARFSRSIFALSTVIPLDRSSFTFSTRAILGRTELDDPASELGLFRPHTETPGERVEQIFEAQHQLAGRLWWGERLVLSTERLRRYERTGSRDELALSAKRLVTRPSAHIDYNPLGALHLAAVGALNCVATTQTELSFCSDLTFTGRIGARYEGRNWEVFANLGRYQRLATLSELYGSGVLVRGNDALSPEVGISPELGARAQWGRSGQGPLLWIDGALFARYSKELVTFVRTAQGYLHPVNRDQSRTLGGEVAVGLSPLSNLNLEGNLSVLDARDTSTNRVVENDVLPFISPLTAHARISYALLFEHSSVWDRVDLAVVMHHQSSRYADPAGLGVIPAQTFGDFECGVSVLKERMQFKLRLSNIWNAQRYDIVGFPLPPRSIFFNTEVVF